MKFISKIISFILFFIILLSSVLANAEGNSNTKCKNEIILHAWNWSFNDIKNNMEKISQSGYGIIQVSPIQKEKYISENPLDMNKWWALYQPINFEIGNILGTEEEFKQMCTTAHAHGVKVIVDVVSNHMANQDDNHIYDISDQINEKIRFNPSFWYNIKERADNSSRFNMTHKSIGMPALNTSNKELQNIIISFLNNAQDCGADGFRFDAAKHIELPDDPEDTKSDYWPTIIKAIKDKNKDSYIYGEVLSPVLDKEKEYMKFMNITSDSYGTCVRAALREKNAGWAWNYSYGYNDNPDKIVVWVESHDTYANNGEYGSSTDISDNKIKLGWSIIASRAQTTPLFFVRPKHGLSEKIQNFIKNEQWENHEISLINKFHYDMIGKNEYIRFPEGQGASIFMTERGNKNAAITNLSDQTKLINTDTNLENGSYKDKVSDKIFKVESSKLTGTIAPQSFVLLYKIEN